MADATRVLNQLLGADRRNLGVPYCERFRGSPPLDRYLKGIKTANRTIR